MYSVNAHESLMRRSITVRNIFSWEVFNLVNLSKIILLSDPLFDESLETCGIASHLLGELPGFFFD